jgi:hypothetical protein
MSDEPHRPDTQLVQYGGQIIGHIGFDIAIIWR